MSKKQRHPEYAREVKYLRYAQSCVNEVIAKAKNLYKAGMNGAARSALHEVSESRIRSLETARKQLYFGRIDTVDATYAYFGHEAIMVDGRIAVMSWHAPVAKKWYLSSEADPQGLARKRHLEVSVYEVLGIRDEVFDSPGGFSSSSVTFDRILKDLAKDRTGRMQDIVATIQDEQYRLISEQLRGALVVDGGPGTGKTAVALHRAAWLRYNHGDALSSGILVIGPNSTYLDYISDVLPSVGESEAIQCLVWQLTSISDNSKRKTSRIDDDLAPNKMDSPGVRRIKGDPRMAQVIAQAASGYARPPVDDVVLDVPRFGSHRVVLSAAVVQEKMEKALQAPAPLTDSWRSFWNSMIDGAYETWSGKEQLTYGEFKDILVRESEWKTKVVRKVWPRVKPQDVVRRLLRNRKHLASVSAGILSKSECELLYNPAPDGDTGWSAEDLVLVDEAHFVLHGRGKRFGHLIVDEVQNMSPMELRAIARRTRGRSMTLTGDLGQATGAWAYRSWDELLEHLSLETATRSELGVSYRVPADIMQLASRLLPLINPSVQAPLAVRESRLPPVQLRSESGDSLDSAARLLARVCRWFSGTVGLIVPDETLRQVPQALIRVGLPEDAFAEDRMKHSDGQRITFTSPARSSGVEFDLVVVLEPRLIADSDVTGLTQLYVSLTRATQHLVLVHSEGIPDVLRPVASVGEDYDPREILGAKCIIPGQSELRGIGEVRSLSIESRPMGEADTQSKEIPPSELPRLRADIVRGFLTWYRKENVPGIAYCEKQLREMLRRTPAWGALDINAEVLRALYHNPDLKYVAKSMAANLFPGVDLNKDIVRVSPEPEVVRINGSVSSSPGLATKSGEAVAAPGILFFSIGHSDHTLEAFLSLLRMNAVTAVADVRSSPRSRYVRFNGDALKAALSREGIAYAPLGRELGGWPEDEGRYEDGQVAYERLAKTDSFDGGLRRLQAGADKGYRIALLCAEAEPLACHRGVLVCRELVRRGFSVQHILADGGVETHEDAVGRLLRQLGMDRGYADLSPDERLDEVYRLQEGRIPRPCGEVTNG